MTGSVCAFQECLLYNTAGGRRVGGKQRDKQAQSMYPGTVAQGQMLRLSPLHHLPITATWNTGAPNTEHPPFRALGVSSGTPAPLTRPLTTQPPHNPSLGSRWSFLPPYDRLRLLDMFSRSRGKFATRRTRKPESAGISPPPSIFMHHSIPHAHKSIPRSFLFQQHRGLVHIFCLLSALISKK